MVISALRQAAAPQMKRGTRAEGGIPPLPGQQDQQAEVHSTGFGLGWAGTALVMLAAGGGLAGCTPATPAPAIEATTPLQLQDPQLMVLPQAVPRIDLDRQTYTTTSSGINGTVDIQTHDESYRAAGIHLGNGVFVDANNNLMYVPQLAFGQSVGVTEFQKVTEGHEKPEGSWFQPSSLTRGGPGGEATSSGMGFDKAMVEPHSVRLTSGSRNRLEVHTGPEATTVSRYDRQMYTVRNKGNRLEVLRYGRVTHTITRQDGHIQLQKYDQRPYVITQEGPTISIDNGYSNPKVITQKADGFEVTQGSWHNRVTYQPGKIQADSGFTTPIEFR